MQGCGCEVAPALVHETAAVLLEGVEAQDRRWSRGSLGGSAVAARLGENGFGGPARGARARRGELGEALRLGWDAAGRQVCAGAWGSQRRGGVHGPVPQRCPRASAAPLAHPQPTRGCWELRAGRPPGSARRQQGTEPQRRRGALHRADISVRCLQYLHFLHASRDCV